MSASGMTVGQVGLTGTVHTVPEAASIREVVKLMTDRGTNAVLVVGPGQTPLGMLTSHDILVRITNTGKDIGAIKAGMVMSVPLITAGQDEDIGNAIAIMVHRNVRQLPIVDKTGRVVSLVTLNDVFHLHLAGTVDLTDIANRLVDMPQQEATPAAPDASVMEEEAQESEDSPELSQAFETHLPFKPAAPLPKAAETRSDPAARKSATRPAATANKRVDADTLERHRDGRRRRSLAEKVQRGYHRNKTLMIVVSVLALVVFFIGMIVAKVGTLFDVYQAGHYEPKDEERARMLEKK
jgi:CBS domain-containing protein